MAASILVDAGFVVALLSRRDRHHIWAASQVDIWRPPWKTCEAVLAEAFHLLGRQAVRSLAELLSRRHLIAAFDLTHDPEAVLDLLLKYDDVPMSLADACLVRMSEITPEPVVRTIDPDFRVYRRHGRKAIPVVMPG